MPRQRRTRAVRESKQIYKNLTFVLTGEFNIKKDETQKTHENITRWIECHGGKVESQVHEKTDYLIASAAHFKNKVDAGEYFFSLVIFWGGFWFLLGEKEIEGYT